MCEPLKAVTRPKNIELRMPFSASFATIDTAGMPFRVGYCSEEEWVENIQRTVCILL